MEDVVILPADKGNAIVFMDQDVYHMTIKLTEMVNSGTYIILKKGPTKTQGLVVHLRV